jgi:hypothetical protein
MVWLQAYIIIIIIIIIIIVIIVILLCIEMLTLLHLKFY